MRFARSCSTLLLAFGLSAACLSVTDPGSDHRPTGTFRVLLIGNSLTYQNSLPALLESLADSAGVEDLYVEMVAYPNFGLQDHWVQGDALPEIRKGGWRYVVLQQGPSALLSSREVLVQYAELFATEIRSKGGIPAFYAVWPASANLSDFPHVQNSYDLAATTTNGALIPAGEAWQAAWRVNPALALYGPDGFHPSAQGTYLAALVMLQRFYPALNPVGLPAVVTLGWSSTRYVVDVSAAPTLQAAAAEAHATYGRAGTP
jgi:hypothetical protein